MNCQEFAKQAFEYADPRQSKSVQSDALLEHAATCPGCVIRLEAERALTTGLELFADDERSIEAPRPLRDDLVIAFANRAGSLSPNVVQFPSRSNWIRWALAVAATVILGFLLFSALWSPKPKTNEVAGSITREEGVEPKVLQPDLASTDLSKDSGVVAATTGPDESRVRSIKVKTNRHVAQPLKSEVETEQTTTSEVKSEFVPLTYLNSATAMESGMVVRVEVAREQLASLGLPFDLERAGDIIKADVVLGDDGVARAIRLVQ